MNLQQALEQLNTLETTMYAYNFALGTISTDAATAAPKGAAECRGKAMSILSGARHQIFANEETEKLLLFLTEHKDELDLVTRRRVEELDLDYKRLSLIPLDEYMAYSELQNKADAVWQEAKGKNDFELFRPVLEELFSYNKRFAGYYDASKAPYDALLDMYERGTTMEMLDGFFAELRKTIVPLLKEIQSKPEINNDFLFQHFPIEQQKKFTDYLMDVINIDKNHCAVSETEHPFTNGSSKYDVRVTTHYYEDNVASNMYSIIHEGGHALYELHIADELMYTILGGGVSTGIHESQSRFYENIIGRSFAFIKYIYPKVQELFPEQFHDISAEDFYKAVNKPEASLIRTEADELT